MFTFKSTLDIDDVARRILEHQFFLRAVLDLVLPTNGLARPLPGNGLKKLDSKTAGEDLDSPLVRFVGREGIISSNA